MITLALWIVALYVLAQVAWHALLLVVVLVDRCQRPPETPPMGVDTEGNSHYCSSVVR